MSAKGRGAPGIELDNYPTPAWCVRRMLEAAPWAPEEWAARKKYQARILEPCAGEGAIIKVLRQTYPNAHIAAADARELHWIQRQAGADETHLHDISIPLTFRADLTITNPPFSMWYSVAENCLPYCRWLALLLRIGCAAHLGKLPTPSLYVLPDRPQFVALWKCAGTFPNGAKVTKILEAGMPAAGYSACGWQQYRDPHESTRGQRCPQCTGKISRTASDGSEYAWFVWGPQEPRVYVLAKTPLAERKGWRPAEAA